MIKGIYTSGSGMLPRVLKQEIFASNMANANTVGYKKDSVFLQQLNEAKNQSGLVTDLQLELPMVDDVYIDFGQGQLSETGNPLDLALEGDGFYVVQTDQGEKYPKSGEFSHCADGTPAYTRDGAFKMSADGEIVTSDGLYVQPGITIPADASEINISPDGMVAVLIRGETEPQEIGQFEFAKFINAAGLQAIGHNLFTRTGASGDAILGSPSLDGFGRLNQGYLEMSK